MKLSVIKQSFFGPPGQYGRLVTRAHCIHTFKQIDTSEMDKDETVEEPPKPPTHVTV